jgi:two-component system chemotaxis sensor kinase CheA
VAFAAADIFNDMLVGYRGKSKLPSGEALRKSIRALADAPQGKARKKKRPAVAAPTTVWGEYEKLAIESAAAAGKRVYHITAQIDPLCAMPIAARQLVLNAVASQGEVLGTRPEPGSTENSKKIELLLASEKTAEQVAAKCRIPTVISHVELETVAAPAKRAKSVEALAVPEEIIAPPVAAVAEAETETAEEWAAEEAPSATVHSAAASSENILRVDAERIDNVLNLVGELIIGKSMMQQALNEFAKRHPKDASRGRFADAMGFQARVLNDLQRSVMKVRMIPVEQLFRRFPRLVRDVSRLCGRKVELVISGQDTDVDKTLLDALAEPLTHIVRNAVSHGIESPEERARANKPAHGTICLDAYHQGSQLIVEIRDDGGGIDPAKVTARALKQGIVSAEEVARFSEAEIFDLVFRPGFSTADEITEVSGRGVGLDVVRSVLYRLKGSVEIQTRVGEGTTFRLKLPLTLAIIKALLFRVEQRLYAIPLNAVAEIARANESDLHRVDNYEVLQLRNQVLPLLRMGRRGTERTDHRAGKIFILVISFGERKLGLIVDAMEGEEELVIKTLDDQTVATDLVSGASILGDGRVVLIMNLAAILDRFSRAGRDQANSLTAGLLLSHAERARLNAAQAGASGEARL